MDLVTCTCCGAVFDPREDTSPDLLLVNEAGVVQVAVISEPKCWPCREGGPITHAVAHADEED